MLLEKDEGLLNYTREKLEESQRHLFLAALEDSLPEKVRGASVVIRAGQIKIGEVMVEVPKLTLDTGASDKSYIGEEMVAEIGSVVRLPCRHKAWLADGRSSVVVTERVILPIQVFDVNNELTGAIWTELYIIPTLGKEIIIGLPDILGNYWSIFIDLLESARDEKRQLGGARIQQLRSIVQKELEKRQPSRDILRCAARESKEILSGYSRAKQRILQDKAHKRVISSSSRTADELLVSARYGVAYADSRIEDMVLQLQNAVENPLLVEGEIYDPWTKDPPSCPEEDDTPDALAFGEDILHYLEMGVSEARKEYLDLLPTRVTEDFVKAVPAVMDLLRSEKAQEVFVPSDWYGLKISPIDFVIKEGLPDRMNTRARPIRPALYEPAKREFDRLATYFYETDPKVCTSPIASPLVIAPKATHPFIRFCGDYRRVNDYITIPQVPIPHVSHELVKASRFKFFIDLDMTNSFHQIPLAEAASQLLSVQTPWGLVRPKFLPEGVGPASGLLQNIVREVFLDYEEWAIVIFDNFLICANDYQDAYTKLQLVLDRALEYGLVLKLKKSWFGVPQVSFFGYQVRHGSWDLSQERKDAIASMPMPTNTKGMQSFLGATLFFHQHVPNYSEWAARLYEMTHVGFNWDAATWEVDYAAHFDKFKVAITQASTLHFPDYLLPWVLRVDASEFAVGSVLYQIATTPEGDQVHQPIMFSSKRFSEPASRWDTYKREAYAIYHGVSSNHWYLRGKSFVLETDHRNLVWIESSDTPIVVRWRALLQSYDFKIRHIPGTQNKVADWLSRPPSVQTATISTVEATIDTPPIFDDIMASVHGGRSFHLGAPETWRRAKLQYPSAHISQSAVREYVRNCAVCQKTRDTGIRGLPEQYRTLKPQQYRRVIGIDHVTVTPTDKDGNTCIILLVEHFSHFPRAYAAKDYSADTVAVTLLDHVATFGLFDQLASDPGAAFMSDAVRKLNDYLGIHHKVSLVGRHESNGCEGSGKQFLRHLRTLVMDEQLKDRWSHPTVLPLVNFFMASFPTSETGGLTPFQLKYGTQDAGYFKLPHGLSPGQRSSEYLRRLDEDIQHIRRISMELQDKIVRERSEGMDTVPKYVRGDLVLWDPRENPCDMLPSKLDTNFVGPFEVLEQVHNNVKCRHVVLETEPTLHVSRLKPFFGSLEDAIRVAKYDKDQRSIVEIQWYIGNPHVRTSMQFGILWEDGFQARDWDADLASSQPFKMFVESRKELFPLRFNVKESKQKIREIRRKAVSTITAGMEGYLSLRYFDGTDKGWYDSLNLPEKSRLYVVPFSCERVVANRATISVPIFDTTIKVDNYDIVSHLYSQWNPDAMVLVEPGMRALHPNIWE
jgi:hypothetical protein